MIHQGTQGRHQQQQPVAESESDFDDRGSTAIVDHLLILDPEFPDEPIVDKRG